MATSFDTLRIARRLKEAGVPEAQAEVFADTLRESREADLPQLATKADLAALEAKLTGEIRTAAAEAKADLLKWLLPFLAAQLLAMLALVARAYLPG